MGAVSWGFGKGRRGRAGGQDGREPGQRDASGRIPIGGDPSQGYYQTTPPPGGEPPMSTTGKSYYETDLITGETTDPRPWHEDGSMQEPVRWGRGRGFGGG